MILRLCLERCNSEYNRESWLLIVFIKTTNIMRPITKMFPTLLLFLVACEQEVQESERPALGGKTAIRIHNTSEFFYKDVVVNTGGGSHEFNTVAPLTSSEYKLFEFAYRYAFVELTIESELATIQPIDYVGETKLESDYYTYEIIATESGDRYDRLSLRLVRD